MEKHDGMGWDAMGPGGVSKGAWMWSGWVEWNSLELSISDQASSTNRPEGQR